ncbi:hypothetical protein UlMin_033800 [Ulmus minor]
METSLLSKLESSDCRGTFSLFSDHLRPLSDLISPKKNKKSAAKSKEADHLLRSLAKTFISFINGALSILPKRLDEPSKLNSDQQLALELFNSYRLCLDCLDLVSSQLACKPYSVHFQRMRMVYCLEAWSRFDEAETECLNVLEAINSSAKSIRKFLPDVDKGSAGNGLGLLVVEIVVKLVKCASMGQRKDGDYYRRVIGLVEEAGPWFRVLDANTYEKWHRVLVKYLDRCTMSLVREQTCCAEDLANAFCLITIAQYTKSSMKDQIYKFAGRICYNLFSLHASRPSVIVDLLTCLLDSLAQIRKVELEDNGMEFIDLVAYCANKCRVLNANFCHTIGVCLNKIAGDFHKIVTPFHLIMRLYSTGLLFISCKLRSSSDNLTSSGVPIVTVLDVGDILQNLPALFIPLRSYFHIGCKENCLSSSIDYEDTFCLACSPCIYNEASMNWTHQDGNAYMLSYIKALQFICLPFSELVNSGKKEIITGSESTSVSSRLCDIQESFYEFRDVFFFFKRCKCPYEGERDEFDENSILGIAVASFIISIRTKLNMKENVNLLNDVISSEWIKPNGLKRLFSSLYNVGVILYRNKQLKEASKVLKLCSRALWTSVLRLCELISHKPNGSHVDLSEDSIVNFMDESCTNCAFLLDVLHQCGSQKVKKTIEESLENWSIAASLFSQLPVPSSLVKLWVKIECKNNKNADVEDSPSTLYCVFSSSKVSKRTIGIILEQELLAYEEFDALYPEFSQKMQMKIIVQLLQDVYVTPDSWLERSRILMRKGRVLRLYGIQSLKDCIQCLSEAIYSLKEICGETCTYGIQPSHQLAVAYCLRAFCTLEAEPYSKQVFQDINMALNLWLSITTPDHFSAEDKLLKMSENMMILLYNIIDLLSLKGWIDLHRDAYRLMVRLFQFKNIPLEKLLMVLWECRRISHALCVTPINQAFLMSLPDHYCELTNSVDFWISCLKESQPLLLGFQHNFSVLFNFPRGSFNHETSFRSEITVDEVKEAAIELISSVPGSNCSVFVAAHLFYDLSERLTANGRLTEALSYAKEAHRLRTKLFQEKFKFSVQQLAEGSNEDANQKFINSIKDLHVRVSVASEYWSSNAFSWDLQNCYLSPWIVCQCYLESTLQVGTVHEIIGNGAEAESLFLWGKDIASSQSLPLFMVAFSSVLGKLYCKKQLWDLAGRELNSAKGLLEASSTDISCSKCRMMLEVTVDQHLADFSQSIIDSSTGRTSVERSSHAENLYKSAINKLNLFDWESSVIYAVENQQHTGKPTREEPKGHKDLKKGRKTRNALIPKDQSSMLENNFRQTRSKYRSSQNQCISGEIQVGHKHFKGRDEKDCSGTFCQSDMRSEIKSFRVAFSCEDICVCNKVRCWNCLPIEVIQRGLLNNFIDMKWEFARRRLSIKLLAGLGSCLENHSRIHEAHETVFQSISVLGRLDSFHLTTSSIPPTLLLDMIAKEISGDVFTIERAEILYNISWLSLKCYHSGDARIICCDLSHMQPAKLVGWLMLAFVLGREVPVLFQKVSRLLAVVFVLSASNVLCSLASFCGKFSAIHWASYFHQASLGTHLNYQFFTINEWRYKVHLVDAKDACIAGSSCIGSGERKNLPRLAPESIQDLEEFVESFFAALPCSTIICISLLESPHANLLQELLHRSCGLAWLLLSRLDSKSQPIVVLLPVNSMLEEASDDAANSGCSYFSQANNLDEHWLCPWGSTVVNNVAPEFKVILEENYLSSSSKFPLEDTKKNRELWWTRRKKLDHRLGKFLRNLEDSWLGPWKYVLRGECLHSKHLDLVHKKLVRDLKLKCKLDVNENLLKLILLGPKDTLEERVNMLVPFLRKGCYIGCNEVCDEERCCSSSNDANGVGKLSGLVLQLICEAVNELELEGSVDQEPIILVLDSEVQMLPWENIPILRNQEVYRMPSVWSITARLDRSHHNQRQVGMVGVDFPFIDPLDAFYLLNPSGDLSSTQIEFENWFRDQNLEGKAGYPPSTEELAVALKSHDLFLYFGHGSGTQYIPKHEIQKLENCAATLLMGCSSGSLKLNGSYVPQGAPLSYLLAGSPVIVANLWEVTDMDIDRFGKAMLDAWLKERSTASTGCPKCNVVTEEFEALSLRSSRGNAKKKGSKKKLPETSEVGFVEKCCHRPKLGSFMGQARDSCKLPFLIGASPVCYGVPTGIRRKEL